MNEIFIWSLALVVSLVVLIKSSSSFTDSAVRLGLFFGIPAFMVGVTIVAIGTSLPELISLIIAVRSGSSEIVVGNVVVSNIINILFIFGIPMLIVSTLMFLFMTQEREITKWEGGLLLIFYIFFIVNSLAQF